MGLQRRFAAGCRVGGFWGPFPQGAVPQLERDIRQCNAHASCKVQNSCFCRVDVVISASVVALDRIAREASSHWSGVLLECSWRLGVFVELLKFCWRVQMESTVTLLLDAKNTPEDRSIPNDWLMVNL